jgi:hypothetical protein
MRNRTKVIAAAVVTAALAAGSAGAAVASTTGTKPGTPAKTVSASGKPAGGSDLAGQPDASKAAAKAAAAKAPVQPGNDDALTAAMASALHVSTARASAALRPLLAAGMVDSSAPAFSAAARSLGVSNQQLSAALAQAKQGMAGGK